MGAVKRGEEKRRGKIKNSNGMNRMKRKLPSSHPIPSHREGRVG